MDGSVIFCIFLSLTNGYSHLDAGHANAVISYGSAQQINDTWNYWRPSFTHLNLPLVRNSSRAAPATTTTATATAMTPTPPLAGLHTSHLLPASSTAYYRPSDAANPPNDESTDTDEGLRHYRSVDNGPGKYIACSCLSLLTSRAS